MHTLYDDLIMGIPNELTADTLVYGSTHCYIRSSCGSGAVRIYLGTSYPDIQKFTSMPLRELAALTDSDSYAEATIGLTAINAYYNGVDTLRVNGLDIPDETDINDADADPFVSFIERIRGRTVTSIGHFPHIDALLGSICDLRIIEKFAPQRGDFPEAAAESLLPESDFVFIANYTFVERSLPRYLELTSDAVTILVGPATPMASELFRYGVQTLSGFVVKDYKAAEYICRTGVGNLRISGHKISMHSPFI